jgi:CRP-like cAMP-binding protein
VRLSSCYLFHGLSEAQLNQIISIGRETKILKGHWLDRENEAADHILILKDGAVELIATVDDVFELPIAIKREPDMCFGTAALVLPHVYSLSARVLEDGSLLSIKKADLQNFIQQDPESARIILTNPAQYFLDRLKETRKELKIHFKTIFKSTHH